MLLVKGRRVRQSSLRYCAFYSAISYAALSCSIASAQAVPPAAAPADAPAAANTPAPTDTGEIVVTGTASRISGFQAPTPVTVLGHQQFETQAPANIGDVITQLPSFRSTSGPQIGGITSRGAGQYFADLRGLGASRTLVLVDNRRYVPSGLTSSVDLNQIPTLLVDRAEVVTGGASAAWGSDAVAGVLNIVLRKSLNGIIGEAQGGISEQGDAANYRVSLAAGTDFAGGRGHVIIGGDYDKEYGAGTQYSRSWGRKEYNTITNTAYATNGQPNYIISPNVRDAALFDGGVVTSGPLKGTAFGANGQPFQFNYGTVYGSSMIGGTGFGISRLSDAPLSSPVWRGNVMAHADYEIAPAISIYGELSYAHSTVTGNSTPPRDTAIAIKIDNPYLPAATVAAMNAAHVTSVTIGRTSLDFGDPAIENDTDTYRGVIGFKGDLGSSWTWDAYAQYGRNTYHSYIFDDRITSVWNASIDAVRDPATGQIVCRSSLTSPGNGCRPVNIIGQDTLSPSDVAYLSGTQKYLLHTSETVGSASIQGKPFETWAGPVAVTAGAEYRRETGHATSDAISQQLQADGTRGGFLLGNPQPFDGAYDVYEFFGEGVVPLARDTAWARSLDLNGAIRGTHYSTSGSVVTWKVGLVYQATSWLRLRGTRSRDIRAPTLTDLFSPLVLSGFTPVLNNLTGLSPTTARYTAGNPDLLPEKAVTWTGGIVLTPLHRLQISADYYNVDIKDAIASIDAASVASNCYAGVAAYCQYIYRDTSGNITRVLQPTLNLFSAKTSGIDFDVNYGFDVADVVHGMGGSVNLRVVGTRVFELVNTDLAGRHDRLGQMSNFGGNSGVPKWTVLGNIDYAIGRLSTDVQIRYVGAGVFDTDFVTGTGAANTITDNHVPSRTYVSLNVAYDVLKRPDGHRVQMFAFVSNLFNVDPPLVPANGGGYANATSTNPAFYDTIGRAYRVGFRFTM